MTRDLYALSTSLQQQIIAAAGQPTGRRWSDHVPRVMLDAWASLVRWHQSGEPVWRISSAMADETADMVLPPDLPLATARVRAEGVCYQLPDRSEWIVIARHAPAPCVVDVKHPLALAYRQPLLTYATMVDGTLCSGYYSLADYTHIGALPVRIAPGSTLTPRGRRQLGDAETAEEDARVALALVHHYMP